MNKQAIVFIHGVSPHGTELERPRSDTRDPGQVELDSGFAHTRQYGSFHQGVLRFLSTTSRSEWDQAAICGVEWGWDHTEWDSHTFGAVHRLRRFKEHVVEGRVRLRLLVTMGSPICMLALRSDPSVRGLCYGDRIPLAPVRGALRRHLASCSVAELVE